MSEWKDCVLANVCHYVKDRRPTDGLTVDNYISTENLLPNKGGYTTASSVPEGVQVTDFCKGDVLVSNIRPYFKKIWQATFDSGCSNDVLVFRAEDGVDPRWLNYVLANDRFFDHCMAGAKGCKMPRGDKKQIMEYPVNLPDLPTQRKIAAVLGALDDKIELNRKMNANLEAMAQTLFKSWFVDFEPFGGKMPEGWRVGRLGEIAEVNPNRKLAKGDEVPFVEMASLSTNSPFPIAVERKCYAGGMKFQNGDTIMARITPCLEHGKAGYVNFLDEGMVGFGSTEYVTMCSSSVVPNEFFYFLVKDPEFMAYAIKHMNGSSGRQRVSGQDIAAYELPIATEPVYQKIKPCFKEAMEKIRINSLQSRTLAQLRDALLPKLMSGELDVEAVKVE